MDGIKPWWESKTVWSDLFTVLTGLAITYHVLTGAQGAEIVSDAPAFVVGLIVNVLGLVGLYGRITAAKKIAIP